MSALIRPREILNRYADARDWCRITNRDDGSVSVYLYDEIGVFGTTAQEFVGQLQDIDAGAIDLHINSLGGSVFDGIAIYQALRAHPAQVTVKVDAMAASIASVIAQAGDRRLMVRHSQMMIHEAHGLGLGKAEDLRGLADVLDKQTDTIARIYADRNGGGVRKFLEMMRAETWFSDKEAVAAGLADEVHTPPAKSTQEPEPVAARVDWGAFLEDVSPLEGIRL